MQCIFLLPKPLCFAIGSPREPGTEAPMSSTVGARPNGTPGAKLSDSQAVSTQLRIASVVFRAIFILSLLVVTVRVSLPQNETLWTAYDSPGDLVRLILGFIVCAWLAVQVLITPKDAQAHRMWIYVGLAAIPFALICIVGTW
jgi:hypothetical protein